MSRRTTEESAIRPLTTKDLDEQIGRVAAELFGPHEDDGDWAPVRISTAEFVRRMQRFVVYN